MTYFTRHGQARQQQRLNPLMVDLLLKFGKAEIESGRHTTYFSFSSRRHRVQLIKILRSAVEMLESDKNIFAVVGDDYEVVTCGHQYKRRQREYQPSTRRRRKI